MFAVISVVAAPDHIHGYVTRFITEVDTGLYVGNISPQVCKTMWERIIATVGDGHATMIYSDSSKEQGFAVQTTANSKCQVIDIDGLLLSVTRPGRAGRKFARGDQNRR